MVERLVEDAPRACLDSVKTFSQLCAPGNGTLLPSGLLSADNEETMRRCCRRPNAPPTNNANANASIIVLSLKLRSVGSLVLTLCFGAWVTTAVEERRYSVL